MNALLPHHLPSLHTVETPPEEAWVRELEHSDEELWLVLQNTSDLVCGLDDQLGITFCSDASHQLLGCAKHELAGRRLDELLTLPEGLDSQLAAGFLPGPEDPSAFEFTGLFKKADATRQPLHCKISRLRSKAETRYILTGRVPAETAELTRKLVQAHRQAALTELTRFMVHEFNNIMTVIQMQASMMRGPGQKDQGAWNISKSVTRASELCQNVMAVFRGIRDTNEWEYDQPSFHFLVELFRKTIGERMHLTVVLSQEPMVLPASAAEVDSLIINLAIDAVQAMPHGGQITLTTDRVTKREVSIPGFPKAHPGNFFRLTLEYTGRLSQTQMAAGRDLFYSNKFPDSESISLTAVAAKIERLAGWMEFNVAGMGKQKLSVYLPTIPRNGQEKNRK